VRIQHHSGNSLQLVSRSTALQPNLVRRLVGYLPAVAWAGFILYLGSRSFDQPYTPYRFPVDKVAHFGLYGVLGLLAVFGWLRAGRWPSVFVPLVLALGTGVLDELRQSTVASRSADPMDFLADAAAIAITFVVFARTRQSKESE
jgi:VanZ family protein